MNDHEATSHGGAKQRCSVLVTVAAALSLGCPALSYADPPPPPNAEPEGNLWMATGEIGFGPIEEDYFLHLTPRLTLLRPTSLLWCDSDGDEACETLFETSVQVPLRLRIIDEPPEQGNMLRREDWHEAADYFRILRRVEYGSADDPIHVRTGELGSVNLGNATIVNSYYNTVTTDHYRLGLQGHVDTDRWGGEALINDLTRPNLVGLRARARPEQIFDPDSTRRRFTVGASAVADFTAPTRLATADGQPAVAGPDLFPLVDARDATFIYGADLRWNALRRPSWSLTPYTDFNHHSGLGSGLHIGLLWDQDIGDDLRLSSRLEYRLLLSQYVPDYIDPIYEITRYQHPAYDEPGLAGPKLTAAASFDPRTRHGGFGQLQARIAHLLTLSAAFSDATGPTGADLRLRASVEYEDRARIGVFYYQFAPGERRFSATLGDLVDPDGALTAAEGRFTVWGPVYAHGQFARQWRLRADGQFENIHLWNAGLGAGATF